MLKAVIANAVAVCALISLSSLPALSETSWYTADQASKGHTLFNNHCAECHRPDLTGAMGPALIGKPFLQHWGGQPVEALYQFEHEKMPATNPGSLPKDEVLAITAYILQRNGLPAGSTDLSEATAKSMKLPQSISK